MPEKNKDKLARVHKEALERYEIAFSAEKRQRDLCIEDMGFCQIEGSQWDDAAIEKRQDRPRYEINKVAHHVNQVTGDQRQNRVSIDVKPASGSASLKTATVLKGLIKNIETLSRFKDAKDNAFFEVCNGGIGAWYVTTEYVDDNSFEQDIVLKTVRSAASSVYFDVNAVEENKQDAKWCFVAAEVSREAFKQMYPKATASDLTRADHAEGHSRWATRDTVRIADYWVKEPITKTLLQMSDGSVIEETDDVKKVLDELQEQGITIARDAAGRERRRTVKSHKVMFYKISGADILEGPYEWPGRHIPVVILFGYNSWVNGHHYYRGMVRFAKDAQRVYNYATSAAIEATALSPKDPFWVTPKQQLGFEADYADFNLKNTPFLRYNPDPQAPGPPRRTGAPAVQTALLSQIQQADFDIQATTGRFSPSLGDNPQQQSGRAIIAQQAKGDLGTFILFDNLAKAVEWTGVILIDLIPRIYDTERQIRIIGDDNKEELVTINKTIVDTQTGKKVTINDLNLGKYQVSSSSGPAYATQRNEALITLSNLAHNNPQFAQIAPDLMAKMVDFPYAEELAARFRKLLLRDGIVEPNEEEQAVIQQQQNQPPSPAEMLQFEMMKLGAEKLAAEVDNMEIKNESDKLNMQKVMAEIKKVMVDTVDTKMDTQVKAQESGEPIPATEEEAQLWQKNAAAMNELITDFFDTLRQQNLEAAVDEPSPEEFETPEVEETPEALPQQIETPQQPEV